MRKYKAFISYSHKDEKFSTWLHKELEKYKTPKELQVSYPQISNKLYPIFRDREELQTSSNLNQNIIEALHNSTYLIVICSINSAKSQWVNKEIIDFKKAHREKKVLAIILDGEPNAKTKENFNNELECFPEALKNEVLSWSNDGFLKLWNRTTNRVKIITKYDKPIEKALFSQDEQKVLSWESSLFFHKSITKIKLWNRRNSQSGTIIENKGWTRNAFFNKSGTQILTFTERGIVKLWHESNNTVNTIFSSRTVSYGIPITKIQFLTKDKILIATKNGNIYIIEKVKNILNTEKEISFLKINNNFFISSSSFNNQYNLTVWNKEKNTTKFILQDDSKIKNIKFILNENKIITWSEHAIKAYSLDGEEETIIQKNNRENLHHKFHII